MVSGIKLLLLLKLKALHRFTCDTDPCQSVKDDTLPESAFAAIESQQVVNSRPCCLCLWWCWRRDHDQGLHAVGLVQGCLLPYFVVRPEVQYKFPLRKLPLAKHFRNMTNFWKNQTKLFLEFFTLTQDEEALFKAVC